MMKWSYAASGHRHVLFDGEEGRTRSVLSTISTHFATILLGSKLTLLDTRLPLHGVGKSHKSKKKKEKKKNIGNYKTIIMLCVMNVQRKKIS